MKHSYVLAGIKINRLMAMVIRNRGISIKYLFRFLFLLNAGFWSLIFSWVEKSRYKNSINSSQATSPLFIVGHWRTGTTLLHQLLALDQQFVTPTVYQVSNPDHFLVSKKYYIPIMGKALGKKRPMDNVKIGIDEPQEDEYALLKLCPNTPLEHLIFPKSGTFFLENYTDVTQTKNNEMFAESMENLVKKLQFNNRKQPLLKNPFHAMRIPELLKIFPDAKFIHVYRNPEKVVFSTQHMWHVVGTQNALKKGWTKPGIKSVANFYKQVVIQVRSQLSKLPKDRSFEIKFEDLEKNPMELVKNLYKELNLSFTNNYEQALSQYLKSIKGYKKNTYNIKENARQQIKEIMAQTLPEYYQA